MALLPKLKPRLLSFIIGLIIRNIYILLCILYKINMKIIYYILFIFLLILTSFISGLLWVIEKIFSLVADGNNYLIEIGNKYHDKLNIDSDLNKIKNKVKSWMKTSKN